MVKAAAGGGGRGIKVAQGPDELADVLAQAAREADAAFGDASLYLEKLLVGARHVEVQVLGDSHGNVVHLYERECSLQRRRQKLLEEAPSPALDRGHAPSDYGRGGHGWRARSPTRARGPSSSCSTPRAPSTSSR